MSDSNLVPQGTQPPASVRDNEAQLYHMLLDVALNGTPVSKAQELVTFTDNTYRTWRTKYPEWVAVIAAKAQADAIAMRKEHQSQLMVRRLAVQDEIDALLLGRAEAVVTATITGAVDGDPRHAKLVGDWTKGGYVFDRSSAAPEQAELPDELPYDPHTTGPAQMNLTVPPGTKVTVVTPDPVLDLPTVESEEGVSPL